MISSPLLVSRNDRLGDLILSLPVLGYLKKVFLGPLALHCSAYAEDIGLWAKHNGLCTELILDSTPLDQCRHFHGGVGLSLFHQKETVKLFKKLELVATLGPRSKLSAIWSYSKSIPQHRSRVEKSEMEYNVELAQELLEWLKIPTPPFVGLPALKIPESWTSTVKSAEHCYVITNRGSAANLPLKDFEWMAARDLEKGISVDFLVSGNDQKSLLMELQGSQLKSYPHFRVWGTFASVRELIVYISGLKKLISSSTGPLHIAHAAGVPVLGFYPETRVQSFQRWRPHGYWHEAPVEFRVLSES